MAPEVVSEAPAETINEVISAEAELLISEYETSINNATDHANYELMKGFNAVVTKYGLEVVLNRIAEDDRDFDFECPRFDEPIQAVYSLISMEAN